MPSKTLALSGTPITGITVCAATTPGKAAAIPAAQIMASVSFWLHSLTNSLKAS